MKKDYISLKLVAVKLRGTGLSYGEIKNNIGVSKSTLSYWLKSIPLKGEHKKRLYTKQIQILSLGTPSQKERRKKEIEEIINLAAQEIKLPIPSDTYKLMGAALYWAEGSKRSGGLEITNSDPFLILFSVGWIRKVFGIKSQDLRARLNIYPQQNEVDIKSFWSELTGIPISRFGKSYIKPVSTGYKKNNLYYGTIRIEVPKSTDLKHKVFGWLKTVLSENEITVRLTQKRWERISQVSRPANL